MASYGFFTVNGGEITRGYQCTEEQAMARAQQLANERDIAIDVCEEPGVSKAIAVVEPEQAPIDPDAQCRDHGCARWRCAAKH